MLKLDDNHIKQVSGLETLESLEKLFIAGNKLCEMQDIEKLKFNDRLMELVIVNNPICRKNMIRASILKRLPRLMSIDGKEITNNERESADMIVNESQSTLIIMNTVGINKPVSIGNGRTVKTHSLQLEQMEIRNLNMVSNLNVVPSSPPDSKLQIGSNNNFTVHPTQSNNILKPNATTNSSKGGGFSKKSTTAKQNRRTSKKSPSPKLNIQK